MTDALQTWPISLMVWVALSSCNTIYDWHVPCPQCGVFQPLRFARGYAAGFDDGVYMDPDGAERKLGQVVWEGGSKATQKQIDAAKYQCGACEAMWTTFEKKCRRRERRVVRASRWD